MTIPENDPIEQLIQRLKEAVMHSRDARRKACMRMEITYDGVKILASSGKREVVKTVAWSDLRLAKINPLIATMDSAEKIMDEEAVLIFKMANSDGSGGKL